MTWRLITEILQIFKLSKCLLSISNVKKFDPMYINTQNIWRAVNACPLVEEFYWLPGLKNIYIALFDLYLQGCFLQCCKDLLTFALYFVTLYATFSDLQSFMPLVLLKKLVRSQKGWYVDTTRPGATLTTAPCCVSSEVPPRRTLCNWDDSHSNERKDEKALKLFMRVNGISALKTEEGVAYRNIHYAFHIYHQKDFYT